MNLERIRLEAGWKEKLKEEFDKEYFQKLRAYVYDEYKTYLVFPPAALIFRAFDLTPFDMVRVVILGQDPYHGQGQAIGLCFAVNNEIPAPPSLLNIFEELKSDLGREPHTERNLLHWANQGVLLLNAILTVRAHLAASHQGQGWEEFTDAALRVLNDDEKPKAFVLWGAYAQKKGAFLDRKRHLVLEAPHPSPLSVHRGFWGSKPFSKINSWLRSLGEPEIDW